jgi:Cu2+-exporting ATPase
MTGQTTVAQVSDLDWATSDSVAAKTLSRRPGVLGVEANAVVQTATVVYESYRTSGR